jgi:hypothetical protein
MGTPALVKFGDSVDDVDGAVYVHWDGDMVKETFGDFLNELEANVSDTRFDDAPYLGAKYLVWQAKRHAITFDWNAENSIKEKHYLDFLSVGLCDPNRDYGQQYTYLITCDPEKPTIEEI